MKKILFFLLFSVFLISPLSLKAVTTGELGIMPAHPDPNVRYSDTWFIFNVDKGQTKEDEVQLINNSTETVSVKVYPVDAVTTSDGAFAPLEESAPREGVGAWIVVSQDIVDIPPQTKLNVPFTITIPNDADVGDHAGALILENIKRDKTQVGGAGVEIVTRLGVRVFETVPGAIVKDLKIAGFDWDVTEPQSPKSNSFVDKLSFYAQKTIGLDRQLNFLISMRNDGNVRLEPKAEIEIKNLWGKRVGIKDETKSGDILLNFPLGMILPQKSTKIPIIWQKNAPIIDKLSVHLKITYDETKPAEEKTITILIIPYTLLAVLGVIIFLIVLLYYLWRLVIYKQKANMWRYVVRPGDNLQNIASIYNVDWKLIAKMNKVKPPYAVEPGKILVIPSKKLIRYFFTSLFGSVAFWLVIFLLVTMAFGGELYLIKKDKEKNQVVSKLVGETIKFNVPAEQALAQATKRDDQRKIDLAVIQNALDKYYKDWKKYPLSPEMMRTYEKDNILEKDLVSNGYLNSLAKDPIHPTYFYGYKTDGEGKSYQLTCILENPNDPQGEKIGNYLIYKVEGGG